MTAVGVPAPEPPAPPRAWRLLPAAIVLAVVLVVLLGGYVIAAALSEPAGPPVDVAGAVRVEPLSGWEVAARRTSPAGVRLSRGGGTLDVRVVPFDGDAHALLRSYVGEVLEPPATQLSVGAVEPIRLRSGLPGARVHYVATLRNVATSIEGQLTAVVSPSGIGVVFDGWTPEGLLRFALDDVSTMIDRAGIA